MPSSAMPPAEHEIDSTLVGCLIEEQHPDLSGLPLEALACGWDNQIFRLGDRLTVRVPRRRAGAELIENEQRVLPGLAPQLPLPIPAPVRLGRPGCGYPWRWSICPYFPGSMAATTALADPDAAANRLGEFLARLHVPAPADAPHNALRGVPLSARAEALEQHLESSGASPAGQIRLRWQQALACEAWSGPPLWLHGDLHPANLLVHEGAFSAVIDFGDVTAGDPATDLAVAWMLFPEPQRRRLRRAAGAIDDPTWTRAHGWALFFAVTYLAHSADNPVMQRIGEATLRAVLAD